MELKPGTKLSSAVCETQVIVVRAPSSEVELGCGGAALTDDGQPGSGDLGLELLCTRGGAGTLTCNGVALAIKGAKPLPASD
jgi:hypothetical protein